MWRETQILRVGLHQKSMEQNELFFLWFGFAADKALGSLSLIPRSPRFNSRAVRISAA